MSQFFSANSNGKGKVLFFKIKDIIQELEKGNPHNYDWNSHTSIAHYFELSPTQEDIWNKWEYNPETKELVVDKLVTNDDKDKVRVVIEKYLKGKNIAFLRNLYNRNSGHQNSGNQNSGHQNSGDRNSGHRNSGDCNSGCIIGHFSSKKQFFLFNKPCTEDQANEVYELELWRYFKLTKWIDELQMSEQEKIVYPFYKTTGGYLKTITYKEAWALIPKEIIEKIKKLKNFDKKVFEEITGIVC